MISQKSRVGCNTLVQSMGTDALYQNVICSYCEIGDLIGAWIATKQILKAAGPPGQLTNKVAMPFQKECELNSVIIRPSASIASLH